MSYELGAYLTAALALLIGGLGLVVAMALGMPPEEDPYTR